MEENINDVAGVRVICSLPDDVYMLAEALLKQDDITLICRKDYIKNPKPNGYRSLHLIVKIPIFLARHKRYMKVEIQLRTIAMDFWASLEHKIYYKFEGNVPEYIREELKECSRIVAYLDEKMLSINEEVMAYKDGIDINNEKIAAKRKPIVADTLAEVLEDVEEQEDKKKPSLKSKLERLKFKFEN